ncbi:asparagine synthetase domain-containing protein C4F6.11c [Hirsutella rhossiliensis]|uniref:Asparagine synthetase domain-containing protein C4F6.11c n=1 Tax=Hirsutella rhossiliensis TaxID=111463 RepID=A0A9P8N3W0_9HYPO|nr:asparagine synthetase domain-containing protein C4F6.11c [Hirsutella rhossiliensis]KAH0967168.1 asparagine synthetase domain-containing protein C4F6.11c [Hirsutella rhossiliensis]
MCGIHATISASDDSLIPPALYERLRRRGPDHAGSVTQRLDFGHGPLFLSLTSTVLSLRGDAIAKQPLVDAANGSALCWNGEAWRIRGQPVQGNDAQAVLSQLSAADRGHVDGVLDVLRAIEGPFAFIYLDYPARRLYYGRDRLGRRSLLIKPGDPFSLSSVAGSPAAGWVEVEADGCYFLQLDARTDVSAELVPARCAWAQDPALVSSLGVFNAATPTTNVKLTRKSHSVAQLRHKLEASLQPRVLHVPVPPQASPCDARIAILFSGGLDCTVLARLTSDILPIDQVIDLISVAFENPRIAARHPSASQADLCELCPDRVTGRQSFEELLQVCPQRTWRLVCVNVPFSLVSSHRSEVIDLMSPHNTEMDLSIAYALYFAARGQGFCQESPGSEGRPYSTTARVLLSGLGADELFGGYVRHATAFSRQGYAGLVEELKLDMGRVGKRNLGRDDRVMAHWEREVRFPYLDEGLARWAIESPVWEKCDFENQGPDERVEPGKRVLRLLAEELGMGTVAGEKKRAIQFGARTAKMESGKVKGTTLISW